VHDVLPFHLPAHSSRWCDELLRFVGKTDEHAATGLIDRQYAVARV
jgi:hypothetical protein